MPTLRTTFFEGGDEDLSFACADRSYPVTSHTACSAIRRRTLLVACLRGVLAETSAMGSEEESYTIAIARTVKGQHW